LESCTGNEASIPTSYYRGLQLQACLLPCQVLRCY
jgi:hypothetical protein